MVVINPLTPIASKTIQIPTIGKRSYAVEKVFDVLITPDIIGSFSVTKHIPYNNDIVDLNILQDIYIDNRAEVRQNIECDLDTVGVNIVTREICPKYEYVLNKHISAGEFQYQELVDPSDKKSFLKLFRSEKYNKTYYTLYPAGEEIIVKTGDDLSFTGSLSFNIRPSLYPHLELKDVYLSEHASNDIGEIADCSVVDNTDKNNNSYVKFDNIRVNKKDFNLISGSEIYKNKSLTGMIEDSSKTVDYMAASFRTHFNTEKTSFTVTVPYDTSQLNEENFVQTSMLFDGLLFKNIQKTNITVNDGKSVFDFKPSVNKNFFRSVPAGIHKIGVREYFFTEEVGGASDDTYAISYETKYVNMVDFNQRGSFEHIYKNLIRPLIIKYQHIHKSYGKITANSTEVILPQISQVYRFKKEYILKSIKPYFSLLSDTYTKNIAVYFGFLINGKITEQGIIHTEITTYSELVNGFELPLPIYIPANKDFFIGFSVVDEDETIQLKYIENGGYDVNNYMISFPAGIQTLLMDGNTQFTNRMLKIDLVVHTFYVSPTAEIYSDDNFLFPEDQTQGNDSHFVTIYSLPLTHAINRFMFFSNDIIPTKASLDYGYGRPFTVRYDSEENEINPKTDWAFFSIVPNSEYALSETTTNYKFSYTLDTHDRYQSPILKPLEHNYLLKKYEQTEHNMRVMPIPKPDTFNTAFRYTTSGFTGSSFKIKLYNLKGFYKYTFADDMNKLSKFLYGSGTNESTYFLIRLMFEYYQQKKEKALINSTLPIHAVMIHKATGKKYECFTSTFAYKTDSLIDNPIGVTSQDEDTTDVGWKKRTIEFIPLSRDELKSALYQIDNIEDWEIEIEMALEATDNNFTLIRNIQASVDTLHVDVSMDRFINFPIFKQPPLLSTSNPVVFTPPDVTWIDFESSTEP